MKFSGRNKREDRESISFAKKRFRFSDWIAEKIIKMVAFMSIAIVALIFIFVFREAFPIFSMDVKEKADKEVLVPESYGAVSQDTQVKTTENQADNSNKALTKADKPSSTLLTRTWMPVSDNPRYGMWPLFFWYTEGHAYCFAVCSADLHTCGDLYINVCKTKDTGDHKTCH